MIKLEDLKDYTDEQVYDHITSSYDVERSEVDKYDILLAYESVGSWGCDSSADLIMRRKSDGQLFFNTASHCSCYGFEEQFTPEETSVEQLEKQWWTFGGYDENAEANERAIKDFISTLSTDKLNIINQQGEGDE